MWIILLITAGQKGISAAGLLSPLHFYTSPVLRRPKGSRFSCHLSFVLAAMAAEPPVHAKSKGNAWGPVRGPALHLVRGRSMQAGRLPSPELGVLHQALPCPSGWLVPRRESLLAVKRALLSAPFQWGCTSVGALNKVPRCCVPL